MKVLPFCVFCLAPIALALPATPPTALKEIAALRNLVREPVELRTLRILAPDSAESQFDWRDASHESLPPRNRYAEDSQVLSTENQYFRAREASDSQLRSPENQHLGAPEAFKPRSRSSRKAIPSRDSPKKEPAAQADREGSRRTVDLDVFGGRGAIDS
ncbi:uncharacterized protein LY89DRAFT_738892 [Mollisia scopiformis]|uniref:Uncharacterized protein n=1 Tax=Mollisia scopiformis TaxID=149040 RepID=A0A194WU24_MOLSC|nr:uncharacterized protein LY89DRAFT_738892 [Mollisia scopiformis]KUJ11456.1 hypothetical protein LY89DRAFT_738892 [Mollisia scopiformis]